MMVLDKGEIQSFDYWAEKGAKNGLQLQSGCHGLSWTVMDYLHR